MSTVVSTLVKELLVPRIGDLINDLSDKYKTNIVSLQSHFEKYLNNTYDKYYYITTLAFRYSKKELKQIFQPLRLQYELSGRLKTTDYISGYPEALINKYPRLQITDTAGMGKSTLMKRIFIDVIENSFGIPVLIELRRLSQSNNIQNEIMRQLNPLAKALDDMLVMKLIEKGGFLFIFDGYDEIPPENKEFVTNDVQSFISKANGNSFILTSRPEDSLVSFGDFQKMNICPLEKKEAYELLRRYDSTGENSNMLISKLESGKYSAIDEFLKNPLMVTLLYTAFDYKQTIPLKKSNFYRQVYDAYFDRHDLTKGGGFKHRLKTNLDIDDFFKILCRFGYECLRKHSVEYSKDNILNLINISKNDYPTITVSPSDYLEDLEHGVPLLCVDGLLHKWVHKSIQEYSAAEYICSDSGDKKEKILSAIFNSDRIDSYINLLDIYFDLDDISFNKFIVRPLLIKYQKYYQEKNIKLAGISQEQIDERIGLMFLQKVRLFLKNNIMIKNNPFEMVRESFMENYQTYISKCILYGDYLCIGYYKEPLYKVMELLYNRMPSLFVTFPKNHVEHKYNFPNIFGIDSIDQFSNDSEQFSYINRCIAIDNHNYYLSIDKVKQHLIWIDNYVLNRDTDDIIDGL